MFRKFAGRRERRCRQAQTKLHVESLESRQVLSAASWSSAFGGTDADEGRAVAMDNLGNAYVGGEVDDQFILAKYDSTGNQLWSRAGAGGPDGVSQIYHLAADNAGNTYAAGGFWGEVEFEPGISHIANDMDGTSADGFIAKYDPFGDLAWIRQLSDSVWRGGVALQDGPEGTHVYVTSQNHQDLTYDGESVLENRFGHRASYLMDILDTGVGGELQWVTQIHDGGLVEPDAIAVNDLGQIYVSGQFYQGGGRNDTYELASIGGEALHSNGRFDPFIAKFAADSSVQWALDLGGDNDNESADALAVDEFGEIYVSGTFLTGTVIGGTPLESGTNRTSYFAKIVDGPVGPQIEWARSVGGVGQGNAFVDSMSIDRSSGGSVYISGSFNETVDFDPDPNQEYFITSTVVEFKDQGFLLRMDNDGNFEDVWQYGSAGHDVVAAGGVAYVTGIFDQASSTMVGGSLTSAGDRDGFLMRVDSSVPKVSISPAGPFAEGETQTFTASAIDLSDGDLSANVEWTLNGVLVQEDSSTLSLSGLPIGYHTLIASVTDSDGAEGTYSLTLGVVPKAPTSLVVAAINATSVTLEWTDNSNGESGYIIERAIRPKGKGEIVWEQVGEVSADTTVFTDDPGSGGNYIYRVSAIYESSSAPLVSEWSSALEVSLSDADGGDGGGKGGGKPKK